ncbi:MAG TPA: hypothetical protein VE988_09365 [Gemmataceae bacterium]|nr:hypothetical protein [Gemmataceae bacterium]
MDKPKKPTLAEIVADHRGNETALQKAGREAVLEHARAGLPVATSRGGKVIWLQPEEVFALLGKNGNGKHPEQA